LIDPGGEEFKLAVAGRRHSRGKHSLNVSNLLPESCKQPAGKLRPVVDPARCEAKTACEAICPLDVFEVQPIPAETFSTLPLMSKLKVWAHGMKTAATPNASACLGCALCVGACPETAIRLVAVAG
jgi:4Fe-4S ferredoxin